MNSRIIYFDNAATSFPKPKTMVEAVSQYLLTENANPGRSGHKMSMKAGEYVFEGRKAIATLFNTDNPMKVVFTKNATEALNLAINGLYEKGDHFITTSMEHNSVLRPLSYLKKNNLIDLDIIEGNKNGEIDLKNIKNAIKSNTRAVVINHASNVNGIVQNVAAITRFCHDSKIISILDASQSAGIIPIDTKKLKVDLIAITGHKSLYGPTGIGALVFSDSFDERIINPQARGGTGSLSNSIDQPDFMPDRFESGTLNVAGIVGLTASIRYLAKYKNKIQSKKQKLVQFFIEECKAKISGIEFQTNPELQNCGIVSFTLGDLTASKVTQRLSDDYNIMSRQGLHCAPLAHKTLNTFPQGTVRFSFGIFSNFDEIEQSIIALRQIIKEKK